jgi:transaldolase
MVAIYCDAASLTDIEKYAADPRIRGFTTNPSLMQKAGIGNYHQFAHEVLARVGGKAVNFEVLADDWPTMERQAHTIAAWGDNVWVKIPVTNTRGEMSTGLIEKLAGLQLNITAVMTQEQIRALSFVTRSEHIISIFAGRIADTQRDPGPYISCARQWCSASILWASTREIWNIRHAYSVGAHIITLTPGLIGKLALEEKDLTQYSLETVRQFHEDGKEITL